MYNTLGKIILYSHFYIFFILFAFIMFDAPWQKYVSIARMKIDGATHLLQNNLSEIYFSNRDLTPLYYKKDENSLGLTLSTLYY